MSYTTCKIVFDNGKNKIPYRICNRGEDVAQNGWILLNLFSKTEDVEFLFNQNKNINDMTYATKDFEKLNLRSYHSNDEKYATIVTFKDRTLVFANDKNKEIKEQFIDLKNDLIADDDIALIFRAKEQKWYLSEFSNYSISLNIATFIITIKDNLLNNLSDDHDDNIKYKKEIITNYIYENKDWATSVYDEFSKLNIEDSEEIRTFFNNDNFNEDLEGINIIDMINAWGEMNEIKTENPNPKKNKIMSL